MPQVLHSNPFRWWAGERFDAFASVEMNAIIIVALPNCRAAVKSRSRHFSTATVGQLQ